MRKQSLPVRINVEFDDSHFSFGSIYIREVDVICGENKNKKRMRAHTKKLDLFQHEMNQKHVSVEMIVLFFAISWDPQHKAAVPPAIFTDLTVLDGSGKMQRLLSRC